VFLWGQSEKEEQVMLVKLKKERRVMYFQQMERIGIPYREPGKESNLSKPIAGEPSSLSESAHQKIVRSSFNGIA